MSQAEWERTLTGGLRREQVLANGMTRTERYTAPSATTTYRDVWTDALRITREYGPAATPAIQFLQNIFKATWRPQVYFLDKERGSLVGITIQDQNELLVNLATSNSIEEITGQDPTNALASIVYMDNRLVSCSVQAESPLEYKDKDALPENAKWRDLFPTFLNLRRTTSQENLNLQIQVGIASYERFISTTFMDRNDPLIKEAKEVSSEIVEYALASVSFEDRTEALKLLEDYDWINTLTIELLQEHKRRGIKTIREVLGEKGPDAFLDEIIRIESETDLVLANLSTFQNILKLTNISDSGFEWREVEIEENDRSNNSVEKNKGSGIFGSEVLVQDHKFRIEKDNGNINITCLSLKNSRVWSASFPVNLPISNIVAIGSNRDKDFREIKPLLEGILLKE